MAATIEIIDLCKNFGLLRAAQNISFTAYQGEVIALLGPNGAGKSTLMNMITGYLAPTSGEIKILGRDISSAPLDAKNQIGFFISKSNVFTFLPNRQETNQSSAWQRQTN